MRMRLPNLFFVSSLAFVTCLLVGCPNARRQVDVATEKGILLLGNRAEPVDLDPQITTGVAEINIHQALFEGLLSPDPKTLDPEPGVAESWSVSEDGKEYTFQIRADARWSNGDAVTAEDFVFSWRRMLNPRLGAKNASLLYVIEGARAYHEGRADANSLGVLADGSNTLRVRLEQPADHFLALLMHPAFYPVHPPTIQATKAFDRRDSGWARPGTHVGNGPFKLVQWRVNQIVEVEKNPNYWDADKVRLNGIQFHPIDSLGSEESAFLGGQLHVTDAVPANKVAHYRNSQSPFLRIDPYLGVYYFVFNTTQSPLDNQKVRSALNLAINREVITERLLGGGQSPAASFTPRGMGGYEPPSVLGFDPKAAQEFLKDAGYPDGAGFPRIELLFNTSENNRVIAEAVQAMWRETLGIDIALRNEEYGSYLESRSQGRFEIARSSWIADYSSPFSFLDLWTGYSANNYSNWQDAEYESLLSEAAVAGSADERNQKLKAAEMLLLEALPVLPIYHYVTAYLLHPSVKGWYPTPLDWHPYKYVYLEAAE